MDKKKRIQEFNQWLINNPNHPDSSEVLKQKLDLEKQLENER